MDGVLIDSEGWYMEKMALFFQKKNFHVPQEALFATMGLNGVDIFTRLEPYFEGNDVSLLLDELHEFLENCDDPDYRQISFPYIKECFCQIHDKDIDIVVASSSPREIIQKVLNDLEIEQYVEFYQGIEDVHNTKPDPEIYQNIINKKGYKPLFVVEDSEYGILSAKRAGLKVIAFDSGVYHVDQSLSDQIITNHKQIIDILNKTE